MTQLNNPAGRLHALLSAYREEASQDRSILDTWAVVLDVAPADVPFCLCKVAGLIPAIESAVKLLDDPGQQTHYEHNVPYWLSVILFHRHDGVKTRSPGGMLIDDGALAALGALSSHLALAAPEGRVPEEETLAGLQQAVDEAVETVNSATDLSESTKALLLSHLHALGETVDYIRITGPGAVKNAADALFGDADLQVPEEERQAWSFRTVVKNVWAVYSAVVHTVPATQKALEIGSEVLKALPPGG